MVSLKHLIFAVWMSAGVVLAASGQQTALSGQVTGENDGVPLPGVIVMLKSAQGGIVRHTVSDENGHFSLPVPVTGEGYLLHFSAMSHEAKSIPVDEAGEYIKVALAPAPIAIREVTIKAPTIGQWGDTLTYRVADFTDIQDKTIGDVLRKMPGIEVAESGEIKYQGEPINKFYVEGSDLLGGRYGLATNNISHDDVQSVELMENHQPIRALKDIAHSDNAALNLRLKEEAKAKWVGTAELGAGTGAVPLLAEGSLFGMRIGRGWQSIQNLRLQNTGRDPAVENRLNSLANVLNMGGDIPLLSGRIDIGGEAAPLDGRRTRFNRSLLFNTTNTKKLDNDYELNLRLNYAGDRAEGRNGGHTTHYLTDGENSVTEEEQTLVRRHDISGAVRLEGNREQFFLKNELRTDWSWDDRRVALTGTYPNLQQAALPTGGIANDFELVRRVGKRTITIASQNRYQTQPHDFTVTQGGQTARQSVREEAFLTHSHINYGFGVGRWLFDARAGISFSARDLRSSLEGNLPEELPELPGLSLAAASSLNTLRGHLTPAVTYRSSRLRGVLSVPLSLYRYDFRNRSADGSADGNIAGNAAGSRTAGKFVAAPSLSLRWSLSAQWTLTGSASAGRYPVDESLIHGGAIRSDYRYFRTGLIDFSGNEAATVTTRFEYKDPIRTLFFNGSLSRSWSEISTMPDQRFAGEYILTGYTAVPGRGSNWTAHAGASKGIDGTKGTVELEILWGRTASEIHRNGVPAPYTSEMLSVSPRFKGRLARWCNAEYTLSLRRTSMSWHGEKSATRSITGRLSVNLIPAPKFFITLSGEHYLNELSPGSFKNLWLADVGATWRPDGKWEFSLTLANLFDQQDYAYTLYGALSRSSYAYRLRPREVLASASFRF